jgi:hypothetical protein
VTVRLLGCLDQLSDIWKSIAYALHVSILIFCWVLRYKINPNLILSAQKSKIAELAFSPTFPPRFHWFSQALKTLAPTEALAMSALHRSPDADTLTPHVRSRYDHGNALRNVRKGAVGTRTHTKLTHSLQDPRFLQGHVDHMLMKIENGFKAT